MEQEEEMKRGVPRMVMIGCFSVLVVIGGVVAAVIVTMQQQARSRGSSAPHVLQARSGEDIMQQRAHGTCVAQVQDHLRWGCSWKKADEISCFNRHFAEFSGYFRTTSFLDDEGMYTKTKQGTTIFYDSVTQEPLFEAPIGRTWKDFTEESIAHGWPSFRDQEVISDRVRVLQDGETVSLDGTHLGHNLPDSKGNRYCINLVSVCAYPRANSSKIPVT